jgi:GT2 family glycosyltransferase
MSEYDANVSVVILNWNGWKDTVECLDSLRRISYPNFDIIVVDNGSVDNSIEAIKKYAQGQISPESLFSGSPKNGELLSIWECTIKEAENGCSPGIDFLNMPSNERMILIENDKNSGFAEGSNIGIRFALAALGPDYILLLNNDTVVKSDFLDELVEACRDDKTVGFAGPIVLYYDYFGRKDVISTAGGKIIMRKGSIRLRGKGEVDLGQYNDIMNVDYVEGSCLLAKRAVLEKVGLLDSRYFLYWEETDMCARGMEAGYKSICVPTAKIWHKVSSSISLVSKTYIYYMTRNKFWFLKAHANREEFFSFLIYFFLRQFPVNLGVYLKRRDSERLSAFLKGVLHGLQIKGCSIPRAE